MQTICKNKNITQTCQSGPFALMQDFFSVKFLPVLLQAKNPVASSKAVGPAWLLRWRAGAGRLIEYRGRCCAGVYLFWTDWGASYQDYSNGAGLTYNKI